MERSKVFEAVLIILIVGLIGLLYFMIAFTPRPATAWEMAGNGSIDYMLVGSDDTLYAFSGNNITAIKSDGDIAWTLEVPPEWQVLNTWYVPIYSTSNGGGGAGFISTPIVDERAGHLYLYVTHTLTQADIDRANADRNLTALDFPSKLLAITPEGKVAWERDLPGEIPARSVRGYTDPGFISMDSIVTVQAAGDREYLFHDNTEDVLDRDGKLLFSLHNVSAPVSVDAGGHIYSVRAADESAESMALTMNNTLTVGVPASGIIDAFNADGSLLWSRDIGEAAIMEPMDNGIWQQHNMLPLYVNDTLYLPLRNGAASLDTDGNLKWVSHISESDPYILFSLMPVDVQGNVYMEKLIESGERFYANVLYTIAPDGAVSSQPWDFVQAYYSGNYAQARYPKPLAGQDGTVYAYRAFGPITFVTFNDTMSSLRYGPDTIEAIDVRTNLTLWNFTIPDADKHVLNLNSSNVRTALKWASPAYIDFDTMRHYSDPGWAAEYNHFLPQIHDSTKVYPGSGVTYVSYDFAMFEAPIINNLSRCIYARGIYALDGEGKVLWEKQFDDFVDKAAAGNGTIYYLTRDGRLGGGTVSIAAGFALAALAYIFLRFFMLGTVTRARSRLEQNENRNAVLRYVADNPGATTADVVKGLGMNTGTIRYHLFILTLNHKIATHKEDDKYLRYFRNAGAYTETERSLVSLLRREPLRRTLEAIARNPGLSGSGLARELNLSATAANRHVSTLADKGIIEQVPVPEKGYGYVIKAEHREMIGRLMARI